MGCYGGYVREEVIVVCTLSVLVLQTDVVLLEVLDSVGIVHHLVATAIRAESSLSIFGSMVSVSTRVVLGVRCLIVSTALD
jgi:hypothetical protein